MCWGPKGPVDVGLLGPCGPVESLGPCGPVGLLRCWGACAPLNCWGLAARWSVDAGTRVGAYRIRPPNIPQGMNVPPRYVRRYVHSAPFGGVRGAYAVAPRGFAAQGFALGYGPPGLQPGWVRPIRALRPVWWAYSIRPYRGTCIRVPSGIRPASMPRQGPSADAPRRRKP